MGTWSVDPFGNDDAADWAFELESTDDLSAVEQAIALVLETGEDYLEAPDASNAIAAIEVLARLLGHWGKRDAFSEPADEWVEKTKLKPTPALLDQARQVIARILGDSSELNELWRESDEYEAWVGFMEELRSRIGK